MEDVKNRGFSLVELIIVIAIMAILVAILAPMFVRYVERSRIAVDVNAVGVMARALKAVATDAAVLESSESIELIWHTGTGGDITVTTTPVDKPEYESSLIELTGALVEPKSQTLSSDPATFVRITVSDTGTGTAGAAVIGAVAIPTGDYASYFEELIKVIN